MKYRALAAGAALALILSGTVAAHFVTPTCDAVTFNQTTTGWTALVQPGDLTFGPFSHDGDNGPYKIAPGSYTYQFVDATGKDQESGDFTVAPCASPSVAPSSRPVPSATPTHPKPTPPATDTTSTGTLTPVSDYEWVWAGILLASVLVGIAFLRRLERR